jgi:hypothetical protein
MQSTTPMTDTVRAVAQAMGIRVVDIALVAPRPGDLNGLTVVRS